MACDYHRGGYIFIFLASLIQVWGNEFGIANGISVKKTIESDDGDTIDCVDIYKQPAFSHPLLKNHTIHMKYDSYFRGLEARNSSAELFQSWHKNGECPKGTIPILRTPKIFRPRRVSPQRNERFNESSAASNGAPVYPQYARAFLHGGNYIGARGSFNVWIPRVANAPSEFTSSQMWVTAGVGSQLINAMETGWLVKSGDKNARFFIRWTKDGYKSTGCYNLDCPGFVQSSRRIALGAAIKPVSTYAGKQFEVKIAIKKDKRTGAWVLLFEDQFVGYWPKSIFTNLADAANSLTFGGLVSNTWPKGHYTTTQMGSGHYSFEGYGKAAYLAHIGYIDRGNVFKDANRLLPSVSHPSCYDVRIINSPQLGAHIYFGGPGYNSYCRLSRRSEGKRKKK